MRSHLFQYGLMIARKWGLCIAPVAVLLPTALALADNLPAATRWDRQRAAHLLRRAGFGGTPEQIDELASMSITSAVSYLVDFERYSRVTPDFEVFEGSARMRVRQQIQTLPKEERREQFANLRRLDQLQIEELRSWWIRRMVLTQRPFEEKMTLFWHGHFTSGHREVSHSSLMYRQNQLFRDRGLGKFHNLLLAISQDPAMLRYLNNNQNRKNAPNENYARELLELFTLGEGNYTETDIKQAARALTGWTVREGEFQVIPHMHDYGPKTFLGQEGNFDGYGVIEVIMQQPLTARHLSTRILTFFVTDNPPDPLINEFATVILEVDFDMQKAMRRLFLSEAFYDQRFVLNRIKSPVELVVGTLRLLEIEPADYDMILTALLDMGQELFQPPNVKGWPGGRQWINTATVFTRYNFASDILLGTASGGGKMMGKGMRREHRRSRLINELGGIEGLKIPKVQIYSTHQPPFDPTAIMNRHHLSNVDRTLNHMIDRFLQQDVTLAQRRSLRSLLTEAGNRFDADTRQGKIRVVSLINALMTLPEYQLN